MLVVMFLERFKPPYEASTDSQLEIGILGYCLERFRLTSLGGETRRQFKEARALLALIGSGGAFDHRSAY